MTTITTTIDIILGKGSSIYFWPKAKGTYTTFPDKWMQLTLLYKTKKEEKNKDYINKRNKKKKKHSIQIKETPLTLCNKKKKKKQKIDTRKINIKFLLKKKQNS